MIEKGQRDPNLRFAVMFVDLDKFKSINDTHGHSEGDKLLAKIGQRLTNTLRPYDTIARFGGDEFIILLEGYSSHHEILTICERLDNVLLKPVSLSHGDVTLTASFGIAAYPENAQSTELLLKYADLAMYSAKKSGKGNREFFSEQMNQQLLERRIVEDALTDAISSQSLINYYQPIVDSDSGTIVGVELLLRWQHNQQLQSIGPYIDIVEELRLMVPMTKQRIEQALVDITTAHSHPSTLSSVNIAASHIAEKSLVEFTDEVLRKHDIPANCLRYEITESALIDDGERARLVMEELSKLGVKIALDDFGTGFSSLSYLRQFPVDIVKIDRTFVMGIAESNADRAIITATIALAKALNMECIAEGVETSSEEKYLNSLMCHYIQGYLYHKPMPIDALEGLLKHQIPSSQ